MKVIAHSKINDRYYVCKCDNIEGDFIYKIHFETETGRKYRPRRIKKSVKGFYTIDNKLVHENDIIFDKCKEFEVIRTQQNLN